MSGNGRTPYNEKSGEVLMPFGKHKNTRLRDIPHDYLNWVHENCTLRGPLKEAIEMELMLGEQQPYEESEENHDEYR